MASSRVVRGTSGCHKAILGWFQGVVAPFFAAVFHASLTLASDHASTNSKRVFRQPLYFASPIPGCASLARSCTPTNRADNAASRCIFFAAPRLCVRNQNLRNKHPLSSANCLSLATQAAIYRPYRAQNTGWCGGAVFQPYRASLSYTALSGLKCHCQTVSTFGTVWLVKRRFAGPECRDGAGCGA